MLARKVFAAVGKWLRPAPGHPPEGLLSPEQVRKVLARERARADRTADRFAVIAFALRDGPRPGECWGGLVKVLRDRVRFTDEVGWLDDGRLCAVLPGTTAEGAWRVVKDVTRQSADFRPFVCTIYSYPEDPPGEDPAARRGAAAEVNGRYHGAGQAQGTAPIEPLFAHALPRWKRCVDVAGALLGLLLLAPLFAAVALAIKLTSPGPVFFRQWRSGRGGRPFLMWKFRSMVRDAEARRGQLLALNEQDGAAFKIRSDPRVTRLGRFLRATSIDELPQLWNVLRGDMSLVGPRPLPCAETQSCAGWQRHRLDATPGLTCIWQVRGRCRVSFAEWMRMDLRYIRSRSPWQDVKLLLLTVPAVLLRRGAH